MKIEKKTTFIIELSEDECSTLFSIAPNLTHGVIVKAGGSDSIAAKCERLFSNMTDLLREVKYK